MAGFFFSKRAGKTESEHVTEFMERILESDVHTYSAQSFCQNEGLKKRALIHMQVNPLTHLDSLDKKELKLILKRIA